MKKRNILTYFKVMAFAFVCLFAVGITKVDASTVTVTTYDELKEAVNGHNDGITDTSITEVKLGADIAIPDSAGMTISVVNDFTFDLNGHTLDITNDNSSMSIYYGSNNIESFNSGSLTITDTSASQTGTIKLGIKPIFVYQQNTSNTGMHYKLTIEGGKFYGKSGTYNWFFEFNTDNSYYWKDKLITFDFKITKGYFEHVSTNMSSIILAKDMRLNNATFNMSFDNLTFKSGGNRLISSNESYSIDDVVPEDTNFYIFNSSEDKQVLIADRSTSAKTEVPSSLWYEVDGYTDTSYEGIKLVKKDGFDVNTSVNGGNGTITSSKTNVIEGSVVEITFTPDTGYMIDKVLVNSVETNVTSNRINLTVDKNYNVEVSYKKIPFVVTVKEVTGASITPNGAISVNYGDDKEFTISVNSGYRLIKVLVDGTDKTSDMVGDNLTLTNITSNMELEVVVEKIIYEVTEGANQKYTITKNTEAKFRIDADYRLFDGKVYIDNVLVDSENYTSESGSTIITFKQSYIDTLSVGEHTLKVVFSDGGEATTKFTVASVIPEIDSPKTGDNVIFYVVTCILSLLGLSGTLAFVIRRKQTN